jgi:hypothetical protein
MVLQLKQLIIFLTFTFLNNYAILINIVNILIELIIECKFVFLSEFS